MIVRYLHGAWRSLAREPAYALTAVTGLGAGLAAALLLLGFVRYSMQYDAQVPEAEQVYVVKQRFNVDPTAPAFDLAPLLLRAVAAGTPGVAAATGYIPTRPQGELALRVDGQLTRALSLTVLPGFGPMLGLAADAGDLARALAQPDGVAVTDAAARRWFGTANAMGCTVQADGKLLRVAAVLPAPPQNTTIPFDMLVGLGSVLVDETMRDELLTGSRGWWGKLLLRLRPGASPQAVGAALQLAVDHAPGIQNQPAEVRQRLGQRRAMEVGLSPLRSAYFDRDVAANYVAAPGERGDPAVIAGLAVMAVLILALASVNYVNLAVLRVVRRQREIAIRKVLGAGPRQLALQLLAEAMLVAALATALGLLLAWLALPLFADLVNRRLDSLLSGPNIAAAAAIGIVLGMLTAAWPVWIAIRVRAARALAGKPDTESRQGLRVRRALTVLQQATAMGFAGVALAVAWQTHYAMGAAPGFDPSPLLVLDLPEPERDAATVRNFMTALSAQPGVAGVAVSLDAVGRHRNVWMRDLKRPGGSGAAMDMKSVSVNFFGQYRLQAVAGRLFDPRIEREDDPVPLVLNGAAARKLGFATPAAALGQEVSYTDYDGRRVQQRVIGIAPELRYQSLREAPHAVAYQLWTGGGTLSIRVDGPMAAVQARIRALWPAYFPDAIPALQPAGAILAADYADDARLAGLLAVAAGIALCVAAFGTYALAAHTVRRRAREIVLRKLHGAGHGDIALLVAREFGALTLAAAGLALPVAAVAVERYLSGFVERAPVAYWTLLAALLATMASAAGAVARQAWVAVRLRPARALRG
ncbi:MAG TPA: FtsX-like permease family protein [Burkholderiaceae bacterium]|nr:FtsX-like permease family protein [Burkholderiaceae bacterium]